MEKFDTIDEYIASHPKEIQIILQKLRKLIGGEVKEAVETMSYGMPTFKLNGKNLVHFAAFKNHIGFFPTPSGIEGLGQEAEKYRTGKGTMQFPYNKEVPLSLIEKIVKFRVAEIKKA